MNGPSPDPAAKPESEPPTDQTQLELGLSPPPDPAVHAVERSGLWVAEVAVDAPGRDSYSYAIPQTMAAALQPGDGVEVPYGRQGRLLRGFVLRRHDQPPAKIRLKAVAKHRPDIHLPPQLLTLVAWAARYYRCHLGEFLAAAVPAAVRRGVQMRAERRLSVAAPPPDSRSLTPRQAQALGALAEQPAGHFTYLEAMALAGVGRGVINKLVAAGALLEEAERQIHEIHLPVKNERFALSDEQTIAVQRVAAALAPSRHEVFLLYGVTGSGKTLVYMDLAQRVIQQGGRVLVLLPEISLTPQLAARFRQRFPRLAVWHSGFSAGERSEQWQRVAAGEVELVIGTRSALFAPLADLGLIIVDEEHDGSYKQDSDPRYHARDLAVVYGMQLGIPVLLGSATPSLESYHNALQQRYTPLTMVKRPLGGQLPTARLINMREESQAQGRFALLSLDLVTRLRQGRERGEQSIILLNRRGWSPIVSCTACGHTLMCPHCDIGLTLHRGESRLRCHYCGHEAGIPERCPACGKAQLSAKGLGTEQLESLLNTAVPGMRTLRVDADTVARKHGHAQLLARFAAGEADCLVGTQMVAKGLDFPRVTTVGVIQADRGLGIPDFRAAERTFQLVAQVAGRAGRGEQPGEVIVQALDTDAPALRCALSLRIKSFYTEELRHRQELRYPPHGGLVRFLWSGPREEQVQAQAEAFRAAVTPALGDSLLLGPGPAGIAVIKDQVRYHALLKATSRAAAQATLNRILPLAHPLARDPVRISIDVDPLSIS
ncbi:MAG: primosomal protein N' [Planctomycetota bacterium]|nr:MAG: primosomal protein N' [Planctomycetota bacterium]